MCHRMILCLFLALFSSSIASLPVSFLHFRLLLDRLSSATQSEKKFLKHLEGSQEIKTFAGAIVDEINNTL